MKCLVVLVMSLLLFPVVVDVVIVSAVFPVVVDIVAIVSVASVFIEIRFPFNLSFTFALNLDSY